MSWTKLTLKNGVAIGVIAIVACALVLLFQTNAAHLRTTSGPTRIAATGDGGWWVISHHHLHRFDAAGRRISKISLDRYDLDGPAVGLGILGDDRVLLFDPGDPGLLLCNERAAECSPMLLRRGDRTVKPIHVGLLQGIGTDKFVMSDSDGTRLLLVNAVGRILAERTLSETTADAYQVPYQPRRSFDGELLIPNRKDRKILRLNSATLAPSAEAFATTVTPRTQRELPVDVARGADGRWWVLNAAPCICKGELVELDAQARPVRRVPLRDLSDPRAIALVGDRLLIADRDGARLEILDTATGTQHAIPDEAFRAELDALRAKRAQGNRFKNLLLWTVVGAPFLGIVMLLLLGERVPRGPEPIRPSAAPAPLGPGITWIEAKHDHMKKLRFELFAASLITALALLLVCGQLYRAVKSFEDMYASGARLVLLGLAVLSVLSAILVLVRSTPAPRIGTDGTYLHYSRGRGKTRSTLLSDLLTDGRCVLAGTAQLMLLYRSRDCFDRAAVASLILARLPPEAFIPQWKLNWTLARRQRLPWLVAIVTIAIVALAYFVASVTPPG